MEKYEKLLKEIYYTEDLINFLPMLFVACIEDKDKNTTYNVDNFEILIQRYSLRMLYHAKNFINNLLEFVKKHNDKIPENSTIGIPIGLDIYFEFDAFLYSSKSIFEKNMLTKGQSYFSKEQKTNFLKIAKAAHQNFISNFLAKFRDEAVHLNYLGTSISQVAFVTSEQGRKNITLHSTFRKNGQELNLLEVFATLFSLNNEVLKQIVLLVIKEYIDRYGMPKRLDIEYHVGHSKFKLGDFINPI